MKNKKHIAFIAFIAVTTFIFIILFNLNDKGENKNSILKDNNDVIKVELNDGKKELSDTKVNEKTIEDLDKISLITKVSELKNISSLNLIKDKETNKENDFKYLNKYNVNYRNLDNVTLNVYYNKESDNIGELRYYYNNIKTLQDAESFLSTNFGKDVSIITVVDGYKKSLDLSESEAKKRNDKKALEQIKKMKENSSKEGVTHIMLVKEPLSDGSFRGTDFFITVKDSEVLSIYERRNSESDNIIKLEKTIKKEGE